MTEVTLYDEVGGMAFFERLVARFYRGVEGDPVLLAMYPDQAVAGRGPTPAHAVPGPVLGRADHLPRRARSRAPAGAALPVRDRRVPFAIGGQERDRWLVHMRAAIDEEDAPADAKARLHEYVSIAAEAMRNLDDGAAAR